MMTRPRISSSKLLLARMAVAEQVLLAENGEQALRTLVQTCTADDATCPRLILLDMNMLVINGLAFLEAYVQLPLAQQQAIVILILTAPLYPVDMAHAQVLPIADFLNKPLTREKVTALLGCVDSSHFTETSTKKVAPQREAKPPFSPIIHLLQLAITTKGILTNSQDAFSRGGSRY